MTDEQTRRVLLILAAAQASTCKESADCANYAFDKGHEAVGKHYALKLEVDLAHLESTIKSLDNLKSHKPEVKS